MTNLYGKYVKEKNNPLHRRRGGENFSGPNLQGNVVSAPQQAESAPPEAEQESNFWINCGDLDGGRGYLVSFSFSVCFEGDDLKKVVNFFEEEKCTPDKILATPMIPWQGYV